MRDFRVIDAESLKGIHRVRIGSVEPDKALMVLRWRGLIEPRKICGHLEMVANLSEREAGSGRPARQSTSQ